MYPAPFEYLIPESIDETVRLLEQHGDDAMILAGGQSLVPMMHLRLLAPRYLVDINRVDFGELRVENGTIVIPALTRQRVVERLELIRRSAPILAEAAKFIGNVRVRNRGTVGGSLALGVPSAELSCAALAAGAGVVVYGPDGERRIPLGELFETHFTTSLAPAELITEIRIPRMGEDIGWAFLELARRVGEFAIVNVSALVRRDANGRCTSASIVLGGVSDRPLDAGTLASELLVGELPSDRLFALVGAAAAANCNSAGDAHASAGYRREMAKVFTSRALKDAFGRLDRQGNG